MNPDGILSSNRIFCSLKAYIQCTSVELWKSNLSNFYFFWNQYSQETAMLRVRDVFRNLQTSADLRLVHLREMNRSFKGYCIYLQLPGDLNLYTSKTIFVRPLRPYLIRIHFNFACFVVMVIKFT